MESRRLPESASQANDSSIHVNKILGLAWGIQRILSGILGTNGCSGRFLLFHVHEVTFLTVGQQGNLQMTGVLSYGKHETDDLIKRPAIQQILS